MKKLTKCIVTGGAGFIGSHLTDELIGNDNEVYSIDNLLTGDERNIVHLQNNPLFHFIRHDVIHPLPGAILNKFGKIDCIYHLASPASPPQYRKYAIETLMVNSIGTKNLLDLAKKYNSTFLLASTSEIYGNPLVHPQTEGYYGNVNTLGIRACYDEAKRFSEAITMEYSRKFSLDIRIVRIFNTYGPRMQKDDGRVVSNFINQAIENIPLTVYGDGLQTRSFCYVTDMIKGIILAMETEGLNGEVINLGNPDEKTVIEIGNLILKLTGSSSKLKKVSEKYMDDPDRRKPDIAKANKFLKWYPKILLEDGLKETIQYFKNL